MAITKMNSKMNRPISNAKKSQQASSVKRSAFKIQTSKRSAETSRDAIKHTTSQPQDTKKEEIKRRAERILPQYPKLGLSSAWPKGKTRSGDRECKISTTHLSKYFGRTSDEIHKFLRSDQIVLSLDSVDRLKKHFNKRLSPSFTIIAKIDEFFAGDADDNTKQYVQVVFIDEKISEKQCC